MVDFFSDVQVQTQPRRLEAKEQVKTPAASPKSGSESEGSESAGSKMESPLKPKKIIETSGKKILEKPKGVQHSGQEGGSKGNNTSLLQNISQSLSGLIEMQRWRMDMEAAWCKEDRKREEEREEKR